MRATLTSAIMAPFALVANFRVDLVIVVVLALLSAAVVLNGRIKEAGVVGAILLPCCYLAAISSELRARNAPDADWGTGSICFAFLLAPVGAFAMAWAARLVSKIRARRVDRATTARTRSDNDTKVL